MNLYEVTLFETIQKTLVYEIKARGEKEAKIKAKRLYKYAGPDEQWTTSYLISEDAIVLLTENNVSMEDDDE